MPRLDFNYSIPKGWVTDPNARIIQTTEEAPVDCVNFIHIDLSNVSFQSNVARAPEGFPTAEANDKKVEKKSTSKAKSSTSSFQAEEDEDVLIDTPLKQSNSHLQRQPADKEVEVDEDVTILEAEQQELHEPQQTFDSSYDTDIQRRHKKKRRVLEISDDDGDGEHIQQKQSNTLPDARSTDVSPPVPAEEQRPQHRQRDSPQYFESTVISKQPRSKNRPAIARVKRESDASGNMSHDIGQQPVNILLGSHLPSGVPAPLSLNDLRALPMPRQRSSTSHQQQQQQPFRPQPALANNAPHLRPTCTEGISVAAIGTASTTSKYSSKYC